MTGRGQWYAICASIAFFQFRELLFFSISKIVIRVHQSADALFHLRPGEALLLIKAIFADKKALPAVIHEAVFIILKDPASSACAILLLQVIRTLFGIAFPLIEHYDPQLPVFKAGTGAQDPVDLFLRHKKSGGLFALRFDLSVDCLDLLFFRWDQER